MSEFFEDYGIAIVMFICITVVACMGFHYYGERKNNTELARAAGYECYLDGEEVDINTVDFSQYSCVFDKENKRVYMTTKSDSNSKTFVIPYVVR